VITELMFPERRDEPWLGRGALIAVAIAFLANGVLLAVFHAGLFTSRAPRTSLAANAGAAALAAGLIAAAFLVRPPAGGESSPGPRRLWVMGLLGGLSWFVGLRVLLIGDGGQASAPLVLVSGAAIAALLWWRLTRGSSRLQPAQLRALVTGALPTSWLLGFLICAVSGGNVVVNLAGHTLFGALMFLGLHRLGRA
jgi:hypothetical protein